jgi:hypothetical protein
MAMSLAPWRLIERHDGSSSALSPELERAIMTSSAVIMPRSPWLASAGCTKNAGVPVLASVEAILRATWPGLADAADDHAAVAVEDQFDQQRAAKLRRRSCRKQGGNVDDAQHASSSRVWRPSFPSGACRRNSGGTIQASFHGTGCGYDGRSIPESRNGLELTLLILLLALGPVAVVICPSLQSAAAPRLPARRQRSSARTPLNLAERRCRARAEYLAEFGIVFLMFSIGLEFSLPKLYAMKRIVVRPGGCAGAA